MGTLKNVYILKHIYWEHPFMAYSTLKALCKAHGIQYRTIFEQKEYPKYHGAYTIYKLTVKK